MEAVDVRRSPRARAWRFEVPWGRPARLTVPRWMSNAEVEQVLAERRLRIEEQRRRQVPSLGIERLTVSESEARIGARELVSALAEEEAEFLGVAYQRIRIGGQRTLWGSCSPRGTLSFDWRLVLAPLEVVDYVVVHELCHLRVPDRSPRFWKLVERATPTLARPTLLATRAWRRAPRLQPFGLEKRKQRRPQRSHVFRDCYVPLREHIGVRRGTRPPARPFKRRGSKSPERHGPRRASTRPERP